LRPWVVEIAGDARVGTDESTGYAVEGLLDDAGRGDALRERDGIVAEFGFGVEEDGFVDEVLNEEGSVEMRATLQQETEDFSFREGVEDRREAEASGVLGDGFDVDFMACEFGDLCAGS
jgi:hypothetical protein